jgi:hypothetical protein
VGAATGVASAAGCAGAAIASAAGACAVDIEACRLNANTREAVRATRMKVFFFIFALAPFAWLVEGILFCTRRSHGGNN